MFSENNLELSALAQLLLVNATPSFENFNQHENKLAKMVLEDLAELCTLEFKEYLSIAPLKRIYNTLYGLKINQAEVPYIMFKAV